tara:strand:+ start:223 stop:681 length:459 start_codon:yes stop_codon:yes gene_type:complete
MAFSTHELIQSAPIEEKRFSFEASCVHCNGKVHEEEVFDVEFFDESTASAHSNRMGKFEDDAEALYEGLLDVLISKQIDYGPGNINNAPGGAMNGILVRMSDKMERLKNLTYHSDKDSVPNHESIDDSLLDIANYAVIAMMVRQGSWPGNLE